MNEIARQITRLDNFEIYALFEEIFTESDNGHNLLLVLSAMNRRDRKEFWETIQPLGKLWLERAIPEMAFKPDAEPPEDLDREAYARAESAVKAVLDRCQTLTETFKAHHAEQHKAILENREIVKARMPRFLSDQYLGLPMPSPVKDYPDNSTLIDLPDPSDDVVRILSIFQCIKQRKSHRKFTEDPLSLAELSYLLWATQGVRKFFPDNKGSFRNTPSGGARQPMETYLAINHVADLPAGIYRYLPFEHKMVFQSSVENLKDKLAEFSYGQDFVGRCAVCFIWTAIPYRIEWRYGPEAKKDILQEAGHICQNLYLTCESIHCGTCGINAYNQEEIDRLIDVDGVDEMTVYLSPVGRVE